MEKAKQQSPALMGPGSSYYPGPDVATSPSIVTAHYLKPVREWLRMY
jgi:hypothetical protein